MYHKELFICVSTSTIVSFFSLVAEIGKCSAQTPSHLPDSHESVVKSKYKSPLYKLWQYATKNKPSLYNDGVVHYNNTSCPQIQKVFTWYKCSLNLFLQQRNYIKQAASREFQKSLLIKSRTFFLHSNNIDWRSQLCFIAYIDLASWIFIYITNLLRKEKSHRHKEYFRQNNFVLQIYKTKRQRQKALNSIGICINKTLHNKVYC
ncbi:hypothetical protein MNL07_07540 [Bartonella krasnovii]|uniref:hypothetical protein n=1 Tax=Bartonella krasnovii TaxID=2267275 RepID=UPI001F4CE6D5|nr:hypothetical protein [Bartonella krasnovii]UNF43717.1 hypothetical protein MNL07_07540 [Bartonella krasnovii]UNF46904.1 hypothetical protein MNL05_07600 [Bartonella krasnovii]